MRSRASTFERFDKAHGGLITKDNNTFNYNLHDETEAEGEPFLGIYPSATPDVDLRVMFHGGAEAETAYRAFTANPDNGFLSG